MAGDKFRELFVFAKGSGEMTVQGDAAAAPASGKTEWVFGRSGECDHVFPGEKISRRHFMIELINGHYYLSDLGSTNGTYLNGRRIVHKERLFTGDVISMSGTDIVFSKDILE